MSRISAAKRDGVAFAELCSGIDLHYSTISQHLKYLRDMKLITSKQRGVTTVHMVHPHMTEAVRLLHCMIAAAGEEPSIITSETNLKALSRVDHLVDDNPATEVQG